MLLLLDYGKILNESQYCTPINFTNTEECDISLWNENPAWYNTLNMNSITI